MLIFSSAVLHRSTFPFERNQPGPVRDYEGVFLPFDALHLNGTSLSARIGALKEQLACHTGSIEDGVTPDWCSFYEDSLVTGTSERGALVSAAVAQLSTTVFDSTPYTSPFLEAATRFLAELSPRIHEELNPENAAGVLSSIGKWYVDQLSETARFVLHLAYVRSGLGYRTWCNTFRGKDPITSPWYPIAHEFPVLVRWLSVIYFNCKSAIYELFSRLAHDRTGLEDTLSIPVTDQVAALTLGLSDPHRGGRSVVRLEFASGASTIYKPKALDIDQAFYNFLSSSPRDFGIVPLKVLCRHDYGWIQDVSSEIRAPSIMLSPVAVGRAGACFWLLNMTDLHLENVAATQKGVFALDLETLLLSSTTEEAFIPKASWRSHSIYTTLLFDVSFGEKKKQGISGFDPSPNLKLMGSEITFRLEGDAVKVEKSVPVPPPLLSAHGDPELTKHIEKGLRSVASLDSRRSLRAFVSGLDDGCTTRIVMRDTYFYARILDRMRQPRHLRDGAALYIDLFSLHKGVADARIQSGKTHAIVDDEIAQLLRGDIPYFSNQVGNCNLLLSRGCIEDYFSMSGRDVSLAKLKHVQNSDIDEQVALVSVALATYVPASKRRSTGRFVDDLATLVDGIADSSFQPRGMPARWISMFGDVSGQESRIDVGDSGFFAGSWGILVSLQAVQSALGAKSPGAVRRCSFLDEQAALWEAWLSNHPTRQTERSLEILGYSGIGGEIFAHAVLVHLAPERWGFLHPEIAASIARAETLISRDKRLDVIGGAAGFALACEQVCALVEEQTCRAAALKGLQSAAEHLVQRGRKYEGGLAWLIPQEEKPLLGYAHGWAGIVAALTCAYRRARTPAERMMLETALRAAARYPSGLLTANGEWRDHRAGHAGGGPLNRSWCNGLPGLLRGLYCVEYFWNQCVADQVKTQVDDLVANFNSTNVNRFCCGETGNADLLLDLCQSVGSPEGASTRASAVSAIVATVSSLIEPHAERPPERLFPGLFHGRSGVAYTAARTALPDLPSLSGQPRDMLNSIAHLPA